MLKITKLALAASLMAGTGGLALSTPAVAVKKEDVKKGPSLKLSPDVLKAAQIAQPALDAKDLATAEPAIAAAEAAAKTDDDKYIAAAMRLRLEATRISDAQAASQPTNDTALAAPLDALLVNPKTPPESLPNFAYQRGLISAVAKQYPQALTYFARAEQLGFNKPDLQLQIVKAKMESGDIAGGSAALEKAIAQQSAGGAKADEALYRYAIAKTNQAKLNDQTFIWLGRYIAAYPTSKNWRDVIATYALQQNPVAQTNKDQKVDLFRLMRATKSLADQTDYEDYADKTLSLGLPYETKAVVAEGRASGKLPAGNPIAADLVRRADLAISSDASLSSLDKKARSAATGKPAAQTADAYLGDSKYPEAIELYRMALQKGGVDADEVNTRLGIALAKSGDKAAAREAFAAVKAQPQAGIASLWSTYLDHPPTA